jgi:general secretion pathway protein B
MSYILNALKQSESRRNRGDIPHIDSQPEFVKVAPSRLVERIWKWLAIGALLALLLMFSWMGLSPAAKQPLVAPVAGEAASSPVAGPPPGVFEESQAENGPGLQALEGMAGVRVRLENTLADSTENLDAAAPKPLARRQSPQVVLELPIIRGVTPVASIPSPPPETAAAPSEATALNVEGETPAANALDGVGHWKSLPPEVQKGLRELTFSAHIYSNDPRTRFIRVSGRTLHEGDRLNAELKLQQITRDGVVLSYRGDQFWFGFN